MTGSRDKHRGGLRLEILAADAGKPIADLSYRPGVTFSREAIESTINIWLVALANCVSSISSSRISSILELNSLTSAVGILPFTFSSPHRNIEADTWEDSRAPREFTRTSFVLGLSGDLEEELLVISQPYHVRDTRT